MVRILQRIRNLIMRFADIKSFTRSSGYRVTVDWRDIKHSINHYLDPKEGLAKLDLNPDFQRGHVWTVAQQIAFVEYGLKGGVSGREIYFNCVGWQSSFKGPFVIVDGKQRLTAVLRFMNNEIPAFGALLKEYTDAMPYWATFNFSINNLRTRAEVLQWYLEMNSGGTPHANTEIERVTQLLQEEKNKQK